MSDSDYLVVSEFGGVRRIRYFTDSNGVPVSLSDVVVRIGCHVPNALSAHLSLAGVAFVCRHTRCIFRISPMLVEDNPSTILMESLPHQLPGHSLSLPVPPSPSLRPSLPLQVRFMNHISLYVLCPSPDFERFLGSFSI